MKRIINRAARQRHWLQALSVRAHPGPRRERHINGNGLPYQVPYPCAYPPGADDSGAERSGPLVVRCRERR
ncbi:MAG: hypothetical protein JWN71_4014 [Xanthobacteraceae bacterium]|jgi:hypothetical protein|nr:hypothetical protein [Xanthobacteraceae bacterium]